MNGNVLLPVSIDGRWGLINDRGEIVVEPNYDGAGGGIGIAYIKNASNLVVVDFRGQELHSVNGVKTYCEFSEQMLSVEIGTEWTYLCADGRLMPTRYAICRDFHGGFAAVEDFDGRWGLIDRDGNWVIEPKFEEALDFDPISKWLPVMRSGRWEMVNLSGQIARLNATDVLPSGNGFYGVEVEIKGGRDERTLYGIIDADLNWAIPPQFPEMALPGPDNVSVRDGDSWINIGFDGQVRFRSDATFLGSVFCGLARAYVNGTVTANGLAGGKFAFVDTRGKLTIDPKYDDAFDFRNGVAEVGVFLDDTNTSWGYINVDGKELWPPSRRQ
ncbi:MAG: hypothetical protein KatS3mg111_2662 [Pirellulaceae bacterium]|nr:MAG: hypothetical protein KatS3mg111_2662 [Pirellulaceae bacterium]